MTSEPAGHRSPTPDGTQPDDSTRRWAPLLERLDTVDDATRGLPTPPAPRSTAPTSTHRRPRRPLRSLLLPVRLRQVVLWQLLALAAVLAWIRSGPVGIVVTAAAALLLLATSVRVRGRTGTRWLAVVIAFRRRARSVASADVLHAVVPGLEIRAIGDRGGNRVGIALVRDEAHAVVRLASSGEVDVEALTVLLRARLARTDIPLAAVALTSWTLGGATPVRAWWLSVRFRPSDGQQAVAARGGGRTGVLRATSTAALGLARELAEAGIAATTLDAADLHEQLTVTLGVDAAALAAAAGQAVPGLVTESWRTWSIGPLEQFCLRPAAPSDLLGQACAGAAFTSAGWTSSRSGDRVVIRVGSRPGKLSPHAVAVAMGVPMDALDGEHALAVRAGLPLA